MSLSKFRIASLTATVTIGAVAGGFSGEPQFDSFLESDRLEVPLGVHVAANGDLLVAESSENEIIVFNGAGNFKSAFGQPGTGNGQFNLPSDVATEADGDIVVLDGANNRIQIFSAGGFYKSQFGSAGTGNGQFSTPTAVAVGGNGFIYVADSGSDRVQVFFPSGLFNFAFGSSGTGDGQFDFPAGIAVAPNGDVVVVDRGNDRVQIFDPLGSFKSAFGSAGIQNGQFGSAQSVEVIPSGLIIVIDRLRLDAQIFSATGNFLCRIGSTVTGGGRLVDPYGVAYHAGLHRIIITEKNLGRGQIYTAVQPDQWIGGKRRNQKGDGVYNRSGTRQKIRIASRSGRQAKFYFTAQNDGIVPQALKVKAPRKDRKFKTKYLQLKPVRRVVTAGITRAGHATPLLAPGARADFLVTIKAGKGVSKRKTLTITAASNYDPGKKDTVKAAVKAKK